MTVLWTSSVPVGGSSVHVLQGGDGPAVLMLHGSGPGTTGAGAWAATAEAIGSSLRLIAPDQAGFGHTPLPLGARSRLLMWTEQAAGLLDALDVGSCSVVGHSMGGAVALALAAARPELVSRVVAVSTMGAPGAPLSEDLEALWDASPDTDGARDMLRRLLHDQSLVTESAVTARAAAMQAAATPFSAVLPAPRAQWSTDLTLSAHTLAQVQAPVLLVHGAQDTVTPLQSAVPLLDHLADVRLHVLEGCGHVPAVEHPREFRRLLTDFLRPA